MKIACTLNSTLYPNHRAHDDGAFVVGDVSEIGNNLYKRHLKQLMAWILTPIQNYFVKKKVVLCFVLTTTDITIS